jgi:F-type H+-transporting ATPase subunit b
LFPFPLAIRFVGATPVSISVPTMVIEALLLIGMVWLMEVLVFSPVRKAWREREQNIQSGLEASSAVRDEAADVHEEVRRILGEARRQAQRSIDGVTEEGDQLRAERIAEATAEFQRLVNEARIEIQAEQAQAAAQLQNQIIDLALQAAAKVTGRSYDAPETRQLAASVVGEESLV